VVPVRLRDDARALLLWLAEAPQLVVLELLDALERTHRPHLVDADVPLVRLQRVDDALARPQEALGAHVLRADVQLVHVGLVECGR